MGLLRSIGHGLENLGLAVEGAFLEAECAVKNTVTDIKTDAKVREYQKERLAAGYTLDDDEDDEEFEDDVLSEEQAQAYEKMFAEIVQHEEFCTRKPTEIGVELGYSEEEVKECFAYAQEKMEFEKNRSNRFSRNSFLYGRGGLEKGIGMILGEGSGNE